MHAKPLSHVFVAALVVLTLAACAAPATPPATPTLAPAAQPAAATSAPPPAAPTIAPTAQPAPLTPQPAVSEALKDKYRTSIRAAMAAQNLPGLSLAVVDENGVVWAEGFGYTDTDGKTPVTPGTPFAMQSVSKMVTADAIMLAVQDGLLDLDAPITTYLPDFTVNSIFEEHPEQKITLRHLLSHTAGFTHEAPVGNNDDLGHWQVEPHVKSIADTWLRFPVGSGYGYSNLGVDLAAYILQVKAGMPFSQYAQERLFRPLGMTSTTYDQVEARQMAGRAIGHMQGFTEIPVEVPMQGSGSLYSTANDMAKFVQWHLDHGEAGGKQLLQAALLEETYKPRNPAGATTGYGLGTGVAQVEGLKTLGHSGGGFGFLTDVYWLPDLGLGAIVLTNSVNHDLQSRLIFDLLKAIATDPAGPYAVRLAKLPAPSEGAAGCQSNNCPPADLPDRIEMLGRAVTAADQARWQGYVGDYEVPVWGKPFVKATITVQNGRLHISAAPILPDTPLTEIQSGLFFTPDGEAVDLAGPAPSFRNIAMNKVGG